MMPAIFKTQSQGSADTGDGCFFRQRTEGCCARVEWLPMLPAKCLFHVLLIERAMEESFHAHISFILVEGLQQMAGKRQGNATGNCRRRQDGPPGRRRCRAYG